ncbi:MAG: PorP/SprF family type IX secretion system membrane protein [Cytophagales bacterium]
MKTIRIILILASGLAFSQDLHFTQFYSTPLIVNPANTGRFNDDARLSFIHRRQWASLNSDFISTALSADFNLRTKWLKKDKIGFGVVGYHDDLAQGMLRTNAVHLSGAYHRMLDDARRHRLSGGLQLGYSQKTIDDANLVFGNQYRNFVYDPNLPNNESFGGLRSGKFDVQTGFAYQFVISPKLDWTTGLSFFQIHQPKESILTNSNATQNRLGRRWLGTTGINYKISDAVMVSPQIMYMRQSKASDFNFGGFFTFTLPSATLIQLFAGGFYRASDAAIALVGARVKNLDMKFTYDATTSDARNIRGADFATNKPVGAYEFSLTYYLKFKRKHPTEYNVPCGIF